jgi:hypothetical protein
LFFDLPPLSYLSLSLSLNEIYLYLDQKLLTQSLSTPLPPLEDQFPTGKKEEEARKKN